MSERFKWEDAEKCIAEQFIRSHGWDEERAKQTAEIAAAAIRREYGGSRHYLPAKNGTFKAKVREEFNGRNIAEMSKRFGISCRTIRRYLRA